MMRWSVGLVAEGDPETDAVVTLEEVVELADAVAPSSGIATGGGSVRYGAQIVVAADNREEAIERGLAEFESAVRKAGLPVYPIVHTEAVSELEDAMDESV
ncbi:hypothetical protein [Pseudonocardia sp. GCM10023141]|uniref:hypothetical protein n=1 Tax=Pseudonocardia sp. GCM10023141 TaxID=3252653 RepID=UPI003605CFA0